MLNELKVEELKYFKFGHRVASDTNSRGSKTLDVEVNLFDGSHKFSINKNGKFIDSTYDLTQAISMYNSI